MTLLTTHTQRYSDWAERVEVAHQASIRLGKPWLELPLSRGKVTKLDLADLERVLAAGPWRVNFGSNFRAARTIRKDGKKTTELLSRFLMNPTEGEEVDHANHDTLDDRRQNLRCCTHSENMANMRKFSGTSRYKGVSCHGNRWQAKIRVNRKQIHLGRFDTQEQAALIYNDAARAHFGEFAHLNSVGGRHRLLERVEGLVSGPGRG